ncbi:MAG: LysM peptidoglycan-binding domain-containing protein [Anaerolineaceae bacterium]|nr:LysM peptidoglycan-binding domain-containing protein [Anaerolineaceae bacterium]
MKQRRSRKSKSWLALLIGLSLMFSCNLPKFETTVGPTSTSFFPTLSIIEITTTTPQAPFSPATRIPDRYFTPTPDPQRILPALRTETVEYTVKPNDTLENIAYRYGIGLNTLIQANQITNPDLISVGDILVVPPPNPKPEGPAFKILPDSELVYGPGSKEFDINGFVQFHDGYLFNYQEEADGEMTSGANIVSRVSLDYSINPRLLLALIEYQSGWVTQSEPGESWLEYPLGYENQWRKGLYQQLKWAANELNRGYYLWGVNGISSYVLRDDQVVPPSPGINAGTAALQYVLGLLVDYPIWLEAVTEDGIFLTFNQLFGYPFDFAIEPLTPDGLTHPFLQLPFEPGKTWSFTGGPHGAWGSGSAWGALDFAPPGEALGCVQSDAWVVAMADGLVVRSGNGTVIQDLDGDGFEQTGWVLLYLHLETRDRVPENTYLNSGDFVGHPSCEGGTSTGTHVHLARKYNGEWISADGPIPFDLESWISEGYGIAYNGYLKKNGQIIEAWTGRRPENQIQR